MSHQGKGRRVLFLDLVFPEPDRHASSVRCVQLLTLLRAWGWQVDFLSVTQTVPPPATDVLRELGVTLLPWLPEGEAEAFVAAHAGDYDLVYMAWAATARRLLDAVRRGAPGGPLLYDSHDVNHLREFREARLNGNARTLARSLRTKEIELRAIRTAEATLAITPADAEILGQLVPRARIFTVGIWSQPEPVPRRPESATLLFVGNMGAPHNHDCSLFLVHEVMPLLRPHLPQVELVLAGQQPHPLVQELAGPDVTVTGWLPDLRPLFSRASLFLAPLRFGSGLKGKMLQAMAHGLPIIASPIAAEGMPLHPDREFLLAQSAPEVAIAVRRLLADPALGHQLAAAALRTLARHYDRSVIARQFAAALDALV